MADFLLDDEIENQPEKTTAAFAKFGLRLRAAPHRGYRGLSVCPSMRTDALPWLLVTGPGDDGMVPWFRRIELQQSAKRPVVHNSAFLQAFVIA
jgi:hypothetical protein